MYDKALTVEVLSQILTAARRIARRFEAGISYPKEKCF